MVHIAELACRCGQGDFVILCTRDPANGAHVIRPGEVIRTPVYSSSTFPEQGGTRSEMLRDMSNPCGKVTFCRSDVVGSTGARSVGRPLMVANDDGGR